MLWYVDLLQPIHTASRPPDAEVSVARISPRASAPCSGSAETDTAHSVRLALRLEREYKLKIKSKIKDFRKRKLKISRAKIEADLFGNEIHNY